MEKTLILDTFFLADVGEDEKLADAVAHFMRKENYLLLLGCVHLVELYSWRKCWDGLLSFLSKTNFAIIPNSDELLVGEVRSYPLDHHMSYKFDSREVNWGVDIMRDAIRINLENKIAEFNNDFRSGGERTFAALKLEAENWLNTCENKNDIKDGEFAFVHSKAFSMMYPQYRNFLQHETGKPGGLRLAQLKSIYLQVLAVFLEYCVQGKKGKKSDVGDFLLLPYLAYCTTAVLDKERADLANRIKRRDSISIAECLNSEEFKVRCLGALT